MSKRRLSKQQFTRIEKRQQAYQRHNAVENNDLTQDGVVIARYTRHANIENTQGKVIRCAIRPHIDSLVAGDRVVWQMESAHQGIILSRYPRDTVLSRPDTHQKMKPIAANISQIMIVIAPEPAISWSLLDSYLVMAEFLKIPSYIVLNKTDLPIESIYHVLLKYYEPLGYPILLINRNRHEDIKLLKALKNQTSVFVGQSGVGKSSIISRLLPTEAYRIQTQALAERTLLGCHTTSHSELFHIPQGGHVIDSPGIRELCLQAHTPQDIAKGYREFLPYLNQCKFRDCRHINTPNCAVIQAVKNKLISHHRYESYVKMVESKST